MGDSVGGVIRRRTKPRGKAHNNNGWPHKSSADPHHCICLDECCQSNDIGCICISCPCRMGVLHEPLLAHEIAGIERQIAEKRKSECHTT